MSGDNTLAPIIIKKKKVSGGDGHHGGAWKVAYADFVTAMMAFFMLMWLLNATTETQRKGIADYFSPTIPINRVSGGGDGAFGGDSVFSEEALPQNGTGASSLKPTESRQARGESGLDADGSKTNDGNEDLKKLEEALLGRGGESYVSEEAFKHVVTKVTDEGLVVEIFETDSARLFDDQEAPTELLVSLLNVISDAAKIVENDIAIEGHVPSSPVVLVTDMTWQQSAERAQTTREILSSLLEKEDRIKRVTGHADQENASKNPLSVRNSRVEIIFLR